MPPLSAAEFAAKWRGSTRSERAAAQEHFIDLCQMLDLPTPNSDPTGGWYAFEKGVEKTEGGDGWADVWKRGHFGWEYKGKHRDLAAAYRQLNNYREALGNPPLLVVCDLDRFEVHTNFTNTEPKTYSFTLAGLADNPAEPLRILRAVMQDPNALRPDDEDTRVTEEAARKLGEVAQSMSQRGYAPERVAHFLNKVLFCLFAEDVDLLPKAVMGDLIKSFGAAPANFASSLSELFGKMAWNNQTRRFGTYTVDWFNGGLFDGDDVIEFTVDELDAVREASALDWSRVNPAIMGTLFERGLDPAKRGQLGAHYTDQTKIEMIVEPVVMAPLRREFAAMQARVEAHIDGRALAPVTRDMRLAANRPRWQRDAEAEVDAFRDRLRDVRVLDPACGSGNFLYVTLRKLKDLEQQVIAWGSERLRLPARPPEAGPHNLLGIELNSYARELASVSLWIGQIQWTNENGYGRKTNPVLDQLDNIEQRDAILRIDEDGRVSRAEWPDAEFIVGNPPFLGAKKLRRGLGGVYVEQLFQQWGDRVPGMSDLACYWHEKAREQIERGATKRAGLLATNSIRGGKSRTVLDRIKQTGDIFFAWSDEPWVVDGAAVRVSIVGQDDGSGAARTLDGLPVQDIHSDLTGASGGAANLTHAVRLRENTEVGFVADVKGGAFDIDGETARTMLLLPANVNGRPNSDVIFPWVNTLDIVRRARDMFIIDFGVGMEHARAAEYEVPYSHVQAKVYPKRATNPGKIEREVWWQHTRPVPGMRNAIAPLARFIVTPTLAKHRVFVWLQAPTLPDHQLIAIARSDDYTFGVLHSRAHERWSLRMGTSLEDRPRYTPTSTFETFPFPWPLNMPDAALTAEQRGHRDAIGAAAQALDEARRRWLNPVEWVREEPDVVPSLPARLVPVDEDAAKQLAKRTLTNLYNARPAWLANLHAGLDAAVFAAYGWPEAPEALDDETMLARLLALNGERAGRLG